MSETTLISPFKGIRERERLTISARSALRVFCALRDAR
jgi:hypothetical protein